MGFLGSIFRKRNKIKNVEFPYKYALIVWTETAINQGTFDEFNKEIKIFEGRKIVETIDFSEADLESIKKVLKIPIVDTTEKSMDDFEFNDMDTFGIYYSEERN